MHKIATRKIRSLVVVALLLVFAGLSSGCLWAPDLASVRKEIQRQIPGASFEKEIELTLGPISLAFARMVTRLVPDAREAHDYLRDVSRIELAVYNTSSMPSSFRLTTPKRLQKMQSDEGWEMAVKVREKDEVVWVMYQIDDERIKELYVIVLSDDELVMVRAKGKLERLVARALKESGGVKGIPRVHDTVL